MIKKIKKIFLVIVFIVIIIGSINTNAAAVVDYDTLETNLTCEDLDYKTSVVDWYGSNLSLDIIILDAAYMPTIFKVYDNNNNLLASQDNLDPNFSPKPDQPQNAKRLLITPENERKILNILFDRVDNDGKHIKFYMSSFDRFTVRFGLDFKTLLDIDFHSFYIMDHMDGSASLDLYNSFENLNFYNNGNLIGSNKIFVQSSGDPLHSYYTYDARLTNINMVEIYYTFTTESYYPDNAILYYSIYELGMFASNDVIIPNFDIDENFMIYEPKVVDTFDIPGHVRNLIGELSNTIYKRFDAIQFAQRINEITDLFIKPFELIPDPTIRSLLFILMALLPTFAIIKIIKRLT